VGYWAPNGHYSADSDFFYYKTFDASPTARDTTTKPDGSSVNWRVLDPATFPSSNIPRDELLRGRAVQLRARRGAVGVSQTPHRGVQYPTKRSRRRDVFEGDEPVIDLVTLKDPRTTRSGDRDYDATSKVAKLTPNAPLADGTLYTATVNGADTNGNNCPHRSLELPHGVCGQVGGSLPVLDLHRLDGPVQPQ